MALPWHYLALLLLVCGGTARAQQQRVQAREWGPNTVRVQISAAAQTVNTSALGYLLPPPGRGPSAPVEGSNVSSGNIMVTVGADSRVTIIRISDGATLLSQTNQPLLAVAQGSAPPPLSLTLAVGDGTTQRRFYGGGCRCGGGCEFGSSCGSGDGGNMLNPGRRGQQTVEDLHFGTPIGNAPGPTDGGLGAQCGMLNGMPWIVAGGVSSEGLGFGLFDNTQSWTYGTASAKNQTVQLSTPLGGATHIDLVITTWPAGLPAAGPARASAIMGQYADMLGHVPQLPQEATGYWHSKDAINSQNEAEEIVANFSALGLHVDVLVLDGPGYKACDSCTAFDPIRWPDPKSMVAKLKANNTFVMAHVHIEQNFSSPYFVGGRQFIEKQWMVHQRTNAGELVPICRSNGTSDDHNLSCRYDPFIPEARAALWSSVKATLVSNGITMFWLDGNEIVGEDTWELPLAPLGPAMWAGPSSSSLEIHNFGQASNEEACSVSLIKQSNPGTTGGKPNVCKLGETFGCENGTMWATLCRGVFECNGYKTLCYQQQNHEKATCPCVKPGTGPFACQASGKFCETEFAAGTNREVGTLYPMMHQLTFAEGIEELRREGLTEPAMTLSRATAAGGWRLGANWDGDHGCQFADYLNHVYDSLDAQLSGQLLWTVDIGGFFCQGSEEFLSRDFMVSVTQPIMRQHGARDTRIWGTGWTPMMTRAATAAIKLRTSLKGYIYEQMQIASERGVPLQRYLWYDFPEDARTWTIGDEFMFGDKYFVAPIVEQGSTNRTVYFPGAGSQIAWKHYKTGAVYHGGTTAVVVAELDDIPLFKR